MNGWKAVEGSVPRFEGLSLEQDPNRPDIAHIGASQGYWRLEKNKMRRIGVPEPAQKAIRSLIACPTAPRRLYGFVSGGRVVLSDDGGVHWRRTAMRGLEKPLAEDCQLVVDPTDAAKIYLIVHDELQNPFGLWYSADSGESWVRQDRGLDLEHNSWSYCLGKPLAITRSGLKFASLDRDKFGVIKPGEDRWQVKRAPMPEVGNECVCADPHHPSRLWRTAGGRLWRSDDGLHWQKIGPSDIGFIACDTGKKGRLAVVRRGERVSVSANDGKTWRDLGRVRQSIGIHTVAFAENSVVVISSHGLLWKKL